MSDISDLQRQANFFRSAEAEAIRLAPRAPFVRPYQDGDLQVGDVFTVEGVNTPFVVTEDTTSNTFVTAQWMAREVMAFIENNLKFASTFNREYDDQFTVERVMPVQVIYPEFAMRVSSDEPPILGARRCYNADGAPAIITSKRRAARTPMGLLVPSYVEEQRIMLGARRAYFND